MTRIPAAPTTPENHGVNARWRLGETPWQQLPTPGGARCRVIIDNDFSGDPDDLFQLVHHVLSPNTEIRAVIASHLREGDRFDPGPDTSANALRVAEDVFARMGLVSTEVLVTGAPQALDDADSPYRGEAVDRIIAEALREDTDQPLYYVAGGGLTDLASALLIEPRIAERMTLIWIGGNEHEGIAYPPPDAMPIEYNLLIDPLAARVVFNDTRIPIWQVPRDVYRQCLVSDAELRIRVATAGPLGRYLYDETMLVVQATTDAGRGPAETYALGDSPLVLLTALQSIFEADSSSSRHVVMPTPILEADGSYTPRPDARPMRVFTQVDVRLMFEDLFLKLREFSDWQASA
ncbi:nucleoside hydrolase [Brachybacterium sp. ACRRE]|uniref:nucleoside hydrolase n=1 Tax=Brachybacterium sp. ACRRE TaxID=2918184 RepID=UPI001EF1FAFB|nr:nucleoside hydrolase [Brachybacterium sp. ACRRE]MCG7308870.1 nucleoside hydrolase [Brachybacterium sp. ACRRE]